MLISLETWCSYQPGPLDGMMMDLRALLCEFLTKPLEGAFKLCVSLALWLYPDF